MGNVAVLFFIIVVIILLIVWFTCADSDCEHSDELQFNSALSGSQEVPVVKSEGTGKATIILDDTRESIKYSIVVNRLSSKITSGHFHSGSPGQNGPIMKSIQFRRGKHGYHVAQGNWSMEDEDDPLTYAAISDLIGGDMYINIHTNKYSSGEIRGQILPAY